LVAAPAPDQSPYVISSGRLSRTFALSPIQSAADIAPAIKTVAAALADRAVAPGEGEAIARIVDIFVRTIETSDFERRLAMLERADAEDEQQGRFAGVR
jgi:hypothetical protein